MMLKRLGKDDAYEVLQAISDYVLNGVEPSNDGLTGMVIEQVVSVIRRKGQKSWNSKNNLDKANEAKVKKEVDNKTIPKCELEPVPTFKTGDEIIAHASNIDMILGYDAAIKEIEKVCERNQVDPKPIKKEYKIMREQLLYNT